jgi:hypothetical protein
LNVLWPLAEYARVTSNALKRTSILSLVALGSGAVLASASRQALPVVLPLVAVLGLVVAVVVHLYRVEGQLPIFDLGVLTILITAVYSAIPLLGFWLGGLQWTTLTYLPLYLWNPAPAEVGAFSLRHVLYLYSFAGAYLLFRGHVSIRCRPLRDLRPTEITAIVLCCAALTAYLELLEFLFDYSYDPSYRGLTVASAAAAAERVPFVVRQVSHNLFAILLLLKVCAIAWLMSRWRDWRWRGVLILWLALEGVATVSRMGARTFYATLLLAAVLLYHRLVKPLPLARAAILVSLLLGGLLLYGLSRDLRGGLSVLNTVAEPSARWSTMNEFQAMYGIAYDLHARKTAGLVGHVPWQIYATDILQLIPSQILPFTKADPCVGYPVVDGVGVGCVLSVIAQGIIGFDWLELILRGLVLGVLFALIHRWYAARQDGYWATMFYLFMCLWCYYTFRGSTFFFAYYVVYRFVPLLIGVRVMQLVLRRVLRAVDACGV